jgi:hypothetical protein
VEQGVIAWYTNRTTRALIIVEDQLSAIRASDYVKYAKQYRTYLGLRLLRLDKDIKDMSDKEAAALLVPAANVRGE